MCQVMEVFATQVQLRHPPPLQATKYLSTDQVVHPSILFQHRHHLSAIVYRTLVDHQEQILGIEVSVQGSLVQDPGELWSHEIL